MKKFTKFALIGMVGFSLTACNDSDNNASVTYQSLLDTGVDGYKINVDINDGQYLHENIDYYFCSNSVEGYDYFAQEAASGPWDGNSEPDFDYGDLDSEGMYLDFLSDSGNPPSSYSVIVDNETLTEGQTYEFEMWSYEETGSVYIRSISNFDCSQLDIGPV